MDNFTQYMMAFYGRVPDAIYSDYGFTQEQIEEATRIYKETLSEKYPGQQFEGDSVDRERVRDVLIEMYRPELA